MMNFKRVASRAGLAKGRVIIETLKSILSVMLLLIAFAGQGCSKAEAKDSKCSTAHGIYDKHLCINAGGE